MNPGWRSEATVYPMMAKVPVQRPAPPVPAIARPTINVALFGATAHMRLPSSKMKRNRRYDHFRWKYLNALPQVVWKAANVKNVAELY